MVFYMLCGKIIILIFIYGGVSSWYGWDVVMLLLIGNYYMIFLFGVVVLVLVLMVFIFYCCVNGRKWVGYCKLEV